MKIQLGIDLGGTKTEIIALAPALSSQTPADQTSHGKSQLPHRVLLRQRQATPAPVDHSFADPQRYLAIVSAIVSLCHQAIEQIQTQYAPQACEFSLGIGIPGAVDPVSGLIKNANTTCLINRDLRADLNEQLSEYLSQPLVIANDADCFALSEASDGAGQGKQSVFAVIIGTGCGGGWVIHQKLLSGPNAICGEWGHNPLPWRAADDSQHKCYCGLSGCLETLISGPGFERQAQLETGIQQSASQWQQQYQQGDAIALAVCERFHRRLAKALAAVVNTLDPEVIVLGGGLSNMASIYQQVPAMMAEFVFSGSCLTPVVAAQHGDSSGVRGAAWLGAAK